MVVLYSYFFYNKHNFISSIGLREGRNTPIVQKIVQPRGGTLLHAPNENKRLQHPEN
jgi:hypothetical protein